MFALPPCRQGFDKFGFDKYGYSKYGYHREGYDKEGYDKFGFGKDGYDRCVGFGLRSCAQLPVIAAAGVVTGTGPHGTSEGTTD